MDSFELTSQSFMDSLQPVREAAYKPPYTTDTSYKSQNESSLDKLTSIYFDPTNLVPSQSQAVDDMPVHTGFGATGNIYTSAALPMDPQRICQPHSQQQLLSPDYRELTTPRHGIENDKNPEQMRGDLCATFDPGLSYCSTANQLTASQRPRFSAGDQLSTDNYISSFVDHPPYAQNPFVYFPHTPARREATYSSYSSLYPPNRPLSNVICPDGHDFPYANGDVIFSNSPPSRPVGPPIHQRSLEKQRQCMNASDVDVEGVDDSCRCKNTVEGTKTSVRRFRKWYKDKFAKNLDMNRVDRNMAITLLKDFFLEIRDTRPGKEGNEYEPVTLTTYRNGLRRYFLERKVPPAPDNFDLADKEFDIVNYHLITKRNELKRKGKGNHPNVVESITEDQLEKMWASGAIGTHNPRALLRLQWWLNTIHHGIRGRMAHHDLNVEDFQISRSLDGKLCIEHMKNAAKRKLTGDDTDYTRNKRKCKARMVATDGSERDPVRAFEVYLKHRPPGISSFYLTPKHKPKGDIWFNKVPMGKNSIGRIMREIKAVASIN